LNEDIVTNLSTGIDVSSVRDYWIGLLEQKSIELSARLDKYLTERTTYRLDLAHMSSSYTPGIHSRTLSVFASLFEQITDMQESIGTATSPQQLIHILVGKQLGEI
jgi:hypothetical protein